MHVAGKMLGPEEKTKEKNGGAISFTTEAKRREGGVILKGKKNSLGSRKKTRLPDKVRNTREPG